MQSDPPTSVLVLAAGVGAMAVPSHRDGLDFGLCDCKVSVRHPCGKVQEMIGR